MIQITPHMRIMVAVEPVDFRKGIDGLCAVCRQRLKSEPFTGIVFVFINKSRTALRILVHDCQGHYATTGLIRESPEWLAIAGPQPLGRHEKDFLIVF